MMAGNRQVTVPPGFRFHPTEEELLYYYLRKKVAYEPIDLDVIKDVDLNKLEPWDLKDKCRIGSGPQNEWYFFSHKDKKYPTGTRTNRATTAGFWKATGRDKVIHLSNSRRIGMRKTLVFYTGRAPHGQRTDWIMHEYRLVDDFSDTQEEGWVVCRVFMKKNYQKDYQPDVGLEEEEEEEPNFLKASGSSQFEQKQNFQMQHEFTICNSMHLPQLLSAEAVAAPFLPHIPFNTMDTERSHNLMKLTSDGCGSIQQETINGEWSLADKLITSHQNLEQIYQGKFTSPSQVVDIGSSVQRFPFHYLGCEADLLKFAK